MVLTKCRHRGNISGIQNLASEYGIDEKAENCSSCDPSGVRKQIKSVAFSLPVTSSAIGSLLVESTCLSFLSLTENRRIDEGRVGLGL